MEDENELDPTLKDQNGDQNHDDDQDENDQEDQDQNDNDQNNDDGDEDGEDTIESLKAKNAKLQEAYENQKKRAEKAESKTKENGNKKPEVKKVAKSADLSPKDLYALMENKVPKEDIDDVVKYANFTKSTVEEALETDFMKKFLADKSEKRTTARATNIGNNRRGSGRISEQTLLKNASEKGEIPDDDAELDRLIDARLDQKKKQNSNRK